MNREKWIKEVKPVVDKTHDLLNGLDGMGQLDGTFELQRITLHVPKAFVYLATYLARLEHDKGDYDLSKIIETEDLPLTHKTSRHYWKGFYERLLFNMMHEELHFLAIGEHPFLFGENEKQGLRDPD